MQCKSNAVGAGTGSAVGVAVGAIVTVGRAVGLEVVGVAVGLGVVGVAVGTELGRVVGANVGSGDGA